MSSPLISVIVPVFNVEKYISQCIESIINQTYQNLEIILVDDGSQDESGIICDKYAMKDQRILVIHQKNGGLVSARKRGLEKAKGSFVGFVDGDDYITSCMYEILYDEIKRENADIIHSAFFINGEKRIEYKKEIIEFSGEERKLQFLSQAVYGTEKYIEHSICTKLFRTKLIMESYFQIPEKAVYGEDLISFSICVMCSNKLVLLDDALYHYRFRTDSITNKNSWVGLDNIVGLYKNLHEVLSNYSWYEKLKIPINQYIYSSLLFKVENLCQNDFQIAKYYCAYSDKLRGKKIIIYGAGTVGKDYYAQFKRYYDCEVIAWIDSNPEKYNYAHVKVDDLESLSYLYFDILLIAIKSERKAKEICNNLLSMGIEKNKIFWEKPKMYANKINLLNY